MSQILGRFVQPLDICVLKRNRCIKQILILKYITICSLKSFFSYSFTTRKSITDINNAVVHNFTDSQINAIAYGNDEPATTGKQAFYDISR